MKLFRGLRTDEYREWSDELEEEYREGWKRVLEMREEGDFSYPDQLNQLVIRLHKMEDVELQPFTDRRERAMDYVRGDGGLLVTIDVSLEELVEHFFLEVQNYSKRKEDFEIVYTVPGEVLAERSGDWDLTVEEV